MTREELGSIEDYMLGEYVDEHYLAEYREEVLAAFKKYRNACIRYGFEKGRERKVITNWLGVDMNKRESVVEQHLQTIEDVLKELDKEQDDKR